MNYLELFEKYTEDKRVIIRKHPTKDLYIAKYTKEQFFRHEWDDLTINNCRGHVYDADGSILSNPMFKVFNVGEHRTTQLEEIQKRLSLYSEEEIELIEKLNGHLCTLFFDGKEWMNTTSGTFDGEFVAPDMEVLTEIGFMDFLNNNKEYQGYTFCFEIIASYDKHLMFDETIKRSDGKNTAFLLYAYSPDKGVLSYDDLRIISQKSNVLLPKRFPLSIFKNVEDLLDHENTEGYILRFPDLTVKLKTKWYLSERHKRGFNNKNLKDIFIEYGDTGEAYILLPEEYHLKYAEIIVEYNKFFNTLYAECDKLINMFKVVLMSKGQLNTKELSKYIGLNVGDGLIRKVCFDIIKEKYTSSELVKRFFVKSSEELFEV